MNSLTVVSSTSDDFIYGNDSHAGLSQRKAAELLKVSNTAIMKILKGVNLFTQEEVEDIAVQGVRGVNLIKLAKHFAKSKQTPPETKEHCLDFLEKSAIIGVQTFIDQLAGISEQPPAPKPEPALPPTEHAISVTMRLLEKAGLDTGIVAAFELNQRSKYDPQHKHLYLEAKSLLSTQMPVPEVPVSPSELGKKIAERLLIQVPSAQKVNKALLEAGLQVRHDVVDRKGRVHAEYDLTDAGKQYGEKLTDVASTNGKTVFPVRWFESVIDVIAGCFVEKPSLVVVKK